MLEDHFIIRLMLIVAVGIVYVKAYMNMAQRNSQEEPKRHLALKILGIFWGSLGVLLGIIGVYTITQITFPSESIGPHVHANMIVRSSLKTLYWGYPTKGQSHFFYMITNIFVCFSLSAYCLLYRSSHSKWYSKVGKVVFCILFFMFYVNATDFHYFDVHEWTAPVLFGGMAYFALRNKKEEVLKKQINVTIQQTDVAKVATEAVEDNSRYMPSESDNLREQNEKEEVIFNEEEQNTVCSTEDAVINSTVELNRELQKSESTTNENDLKIKTETTDSVSEPTMKFCRHCGKKIDYESDKYCKYCGKPLN